MKPVTLSPYVNNFISHQGVQPSFGYNVTADMGTSSSRLTLKVAVCSDVTGKEIYSETGYVLQPQEKILNSDYYVKRIGDRVNEVIQKAQPLLQKKLQGTDPRSVEDRETISSFVLFAGGYVLEGKRIDYLPNQNIRDIYNKHLTHIDYTRLDIPAKRIIATNDLHGTGAVIAKKLDQENRLRDGFFATISMPGGGFGYVNIKVKSGVLEIEGAETNSILSRDNMNTLEYDAVCVPAMIRNYVKILNEKYGYSLNGDKLVAEGNAKEIIADKFLNGTEQEQEAATYAIHKLIDGISQEFARKITDGADVGILSGNIIKGIKEAFSIKYDGDPENSLEKVFERNIDKYLKEVALFMKKAHHFKVEYIEVPNNTLGGPLVGISKFEPHRGNWLSVPLEDVRNLPEI